MNNLLLKKYFFLNKIYYIRRFDHKIITFLTFQKTINKQFKFINKAHELYTTMKLIGV